uniref:DENN/MADD domain containing 1A n=1 Tax=Salarias fasciatus TaxID=181472 RepID=A0A672J2Q0_SALFA
MNVNQHRCLSLSLPPSLSFSSSLSLSPSPSLSLSLTLSPCSLIFNQVGQNFTFVLTDIESKQRFGFCRLSSGAHTCYCILSYLPWFEVFYKLLNILADYRVKGQVRLPGPGVWGSEVNWSDRVWVCRLFPGEPHSFFTVPDPTELPSIPENRNLTEYFVAVDVNNMLHLYASMLYERRILICCSKLSTLTACVHGSAAMLFPMHWQHVYIPVLPQHLLDYCCAPMPYLIGVHSSLMEKVRGMALDDVVILNVDTNMLETPHDDLQSLPNDVVSALKSRLKKVSTTTGVGVAQAFLKSQAALFGSYRSALHIESGEPITFSEDAFINHRSSAMRQFLHNAIQLQLFKQFIDGRLDLLNSGEGFNDIFEEEINMGEYAGDGEPPSPRLSDRKQYFCVLMFFLLYPSVFCWLSGADSQGQQSEQGSPDCPGPRPLLRAQTRSCSPQTGPPEPDPLQSLVPEPDPLQPLVPEPDPLQPLVPKLVPEPDPLQSLVPEPDPLQPLVPEPDPLQSLVPEPDPLQPLVPEPDPLQPLVPEPDPLQPLVPEPDPLQPLAAHRNVFSLVGSNISSFLVSVTERNISAAECDQRSASAPF